MTSKRVLLFFPQCETEKPVVYHLVKDYNLVVNIFRAKVTPEEEGYLALDLSGEQDALEKAFGFLRSLGIELQENKRGLRWNEEMCTSCGACLTHCPTGALVAEPETRKVLFKAEHCIECLSCLTVCPFGACHSVF